MDKHPKALREASRSDSKNPSKTGEKPPKVENAKPVFPKTT